MALDLRPIKTAFKRLAASDTPLKRRNARLAFARALRDMERTAEADYPALRKDGSAIVRRKPRGARCPKCRAPMKSFAALAKHLNTAHGHEYGRCACKKYFGRRLANHLAGLDDVAAHFATAVLLDSAGV